MDNLAKRLFDTGPLMTEASLMIVRLQTALVNLADAADAVGVKYFDTDTMSEEVEAMQQATQEARAVLKS